MDTQPQERFEFNANMKKLWRVFVLSAVLVFYGGHGFTVEMETNLRAELLSNYSDKVRPELVTLVQLSVNLLSINLMKWTDSRLSWTGTSYTVPVIQVYQSEIWTPALVIDNSVDNLSAIGEDSIPLRVRQDGQVTWNPPGILLTSCEMDVTYFPFDTQTCGLEVTSFGYTIEELNITVQSTGVNTKYYSENGEWELLATWNQRSEFEEDGYDNAHVTFYFQLQRHAVYYGLNTMLPALLNSLLIPLVFLLPHDAGEKIGYCLTVLLAYVVILTIVTDGLPTTAKNQSLLGVYIAAVLILSGTAVGLAIHSLHIYQRPFSQPVPGWQVRLTRRVVRLMKCKPSACRDACARKRRVEDVPGKTPPHEDGPWEYSVSDDSKPELKKRPVTAASCSKVKAGITEKVEEEGDMTWHHVAKVYDSFLFMFYVVIIFVFSVGFLFAIVSSRL